MRTALYLSLLLATPLSAQQPTPASSGSITGLVTDAASGKPLPDVLIDLTSRNKTARTTSDPDGRYRFNGLPDGAFRLVAGNGTPNYLSTSSEVRLGEGVLNATSNLKLTRESTLSGRVFDRDHKPVSGARVILRYQDFYDGRPYSDGVRIATTNANGDYRIAGLPPRPGYLEVIPQMAALHRGSSGDEAPVNANILTYYPNTPSMETATRLAIGKSEQLEHTDITLLRADTYCLSATAPEAAAGSKEVEVQVRELVPMSQVMISGGTVPGAAQFAICGIPAGSYRLLSLGGAAQTGLKVATQVFTIANRNLRLPALTLAVAQPVAGTVTIEGTVPERVPEFQVTFGLKDRGMLVPGENLSAKVDASGKFQIPAVIDDDYWLAVSGLPPGYYVKSAASNGHDAWREPVHGAGALQIVLGADGPSVSGTAEDGERKPVAGAVVALYLSTLPDRLAPKELMTTRADAKGSFSFRGMAPGDYRVLALTDVTEYQASDPGLLRSGVLRTDQLELAPKENKSLHVAVQALPGRN